MASQRNWKYLGQLSPLWHIWQNKRNPTRLITSVRGLNEKDDAGNINPKFDDIIYDVKDGTIAAAVKNKHSLQIKGDSVKLGCQRFDRKIIRSLMRKAGLSLSMRSTK